VSVGGPKRELDLSDDERRRSSGGRAANSVRSPTRTWNGYRQDTGRDAVGATHWSTRSMAQVVG